jgi:mono/diheme cytochrome c family protein
MIKVLKWIGIVLGGLIGLLILAILGLSFAGGARLNKTHRVQAQNIPIHNNEAILARGEHLVDIACKDCHMPDLTGQPLLEDPAIGTVYSANITGLAQTHSDADIIRAIRHAVDTDGRQLMIMPAETFIHFSAEDLGAVVAYLKTVPRSGEEHPTPRISLMGRVLLAAGMFGDVFPAEYIDHNMPFHDRPEIGANAAYGEYVARFCQGCHGENLQGSQPPDPESPFAPNLAVVASWSQAEFIQFFRSGVTPYGREVKGQFMPWESFGKFEDEELQGLWMYLQTMPAAETASQ